MPENLARLLAVVRILLHAGHRLLTLIERRSARPGFWLFSAVFGARKRAVMRASLHRGLLRAAALESLLLKRAATGRDVAALRFPARAAASGDAPLHPCDAPFSEQVARLAAERAQHDAPVDPRHPATEEAIAAEVLARSVGRTLAEIRRDLGIVAAMCTAPFWDLLTGAIAGYQDGTAAECLDDTAPAPEPLPQQPEQASAAPQPGRSPQRLPRRGLTGETDDSRVIPFPAASRRITSRAMVTAPHRYAVVPPATTGPPPRAAMLLAA